MNPRDVVVISAVRTPFSKFGGALKDTPGVELAAHVIQESLRRINLSPDRVDEVYLGTCVPAETGPLAPVVARQALLAAGLPEQTVSVTLDRACCSSLTAVQMAYRSICLGEADVAIAVGAENLSRTPYVMPQLRWGARMGHVTVGDGLQMQYPGYAPVAVDTGMIASEHGEGREAQDEWAYRSQQRYQEALKAGKYDEEIAPLTLKTRKGAVTFAADEFPKPDTTLEGLGKLGTVYGSPTVTPGNAPGLDAGATAIVLMSRAKAEELMLKSLAEILTVASVAGDPRDIVTIPAVAIQKGLERLKLKVEDLALVEINEAFAAMPLVSTRMLAEGDARKLETLREKTNVNGGAIAIGHPVGASGARILMALVNELNRRGGGLGAAAICGGLGQGDCAIVKV